MKLQTKSTAITNASIETRTNECGCTYYQVIGDTERFGEQELLFEGISRQEAEKYIEMYTIKDTVTTNQETTIVNDTISKEAKEASNKDSAKDLISRSFEIAFTAKSDMYEKFMERTWFLTGDRGFDGEVYIASNKGIYFKLEGTRSTFSAFVTTGGEVIRKPKNIIFDALYDIKGNDKEIERVVHITYGRKHSSYKVKQDV